MALFVLILAIVLLLAIVVFSPAIGENSIQVKKGRGIYFTFLYTITAVRGKIVIKSVTLNRGNSNIDRWILINGNLIFQDRVEAHNPFPITLKFGQTAAFQSGCDAIEIKVKRTSGRKHWFGLSALSGHRSLARHEISQNPFVWIALDDVYQQRKGTAAFRRACLETGMGGSFLCVPAQLWLASSAARRRSVERCGGFASGPDVLALPMTIL